MKYPKKFIEKVKKEFPNNKELHKKLEEGNSIVGLFLKNDKEFEMSAFQIIEAFAEGRQEDVKKAAEKCVRREDLYLEWVKLSDDQN